MNKIKNLAIFILAVFIPATMMTIVISVFALGVRTFTPLIVGTRKCSSKR